MINAVIERIVNAHCPKDDIPEDWDLQAIADYANGNFLHEGMLTRRRYLGQGKRRNH